MLVIVNSNSNRVIVIVVVRPERQAQCQAGPDIEITQIIAATVSHLVW